MALVGLSVAACTGSGVEAIHWTDAERSFTEAVENLGDRHASLGELIPGDWETATAFPPYTDNDDVKIAIGHEFDRERAPWALTEGGNVVALVDEGGVAGWIAVDWGTTFFACIPLVIPRDTELRAAATESGERVLVPADKLTCRDAGLGDIE